MSELVQALYMHLPLLPNTTLTIVLIFLSIQSYCRSYLAHSQYMGLKKAAITTQCAWRGRLARRELRKLKMVRTTM